MEIKNEEIIYKDYIKSENNLMKLIKSKVNLKKIFSFKSEEKKLILRRLNKYCQSKLGISL